MLRGALLRRLLGLVAALEISAGAASPRPGLALPTQLDLRRPNRQLDSDKEPLLLRGP